MDIQVVPVKKEEIEILRNLLEKYGYELSQYFKNDVNDLGLFGYDYLDCYFYEENRHPFFVKVDNKLTGFIMINDYPESKVKTDYSVSEFFILHKYRKNGIGKYALNYVLNKFKGKKWQLKFHPNNEISKNFWLKSIDEYTKGKYEIIKDDREAIYDDGTIGWVLLFET